MLPFVDTTILLFASLLRLTVQLIGAEATVAVYALNERQAIGRALHYGDVLMSPKQLRLRRYRTSGVDPKLIRHIAVKERASNRWPNNQIPYQISNRYFAPEKEKLLAAFRTLEKHSCFKFVPHSDEIDYLFIEKMEGCFSFVGRIGGRQLVSLNSGCLYDYIIWHELMHAIGLEHEHQRPDRDLYIQIQYENVDPEKLMNFELLPAVDVDFYHGYDYTSIMHYDGRAFGRFDPVSRQPMVTMVPLKSNVELVDNLALTEMDTEKLRLLGSCPSRPSLSLKSPDTSPESDELDGSAGDSAFNSYTWRIPPTDVFNGRQNAKSIESSTEINKNAVIPLTNTSGTVSVMVPSLNKAPCTNRSDKCTHFVEKGYCSNYKYKRIMLLYCPASCGYCDLTDIA